MNCCSGAEDASADCFRDVSKDKSIRAGKPGGRQNRTPASYDKRQYKRCSKIDIIFGKRKNEGACK
jgi:hypothetical protein